MINKVVDKSQKVRTLYEIIDVFVFNGEVFLKIQETNGRKSKFKWISYRRMENHSKEVEMHK